MTEPTQERVAEIARERPLPPICADFDDDCYEIANKVCCWLYDPAKGMCPYLQGRGR